MTPDELNKLLDDESLISGVHNYCNRWCERCPFTTRCSVFRMEQAAGLNDHVEDPTLPAPDVDTTLDHVSDMFALTRQMLEEGIKEQGLDFDEIVAEARTAPKRRKIRQPRFIKDAMTYATGVMKWLTRNRSTFQARAAELEQVHAAGLPGSDPQHTLDSITDALEIIEWHLFFIHVKLRRALPDEFDDPDDEDANRDAHGSAKIALIALDDSIAAWTRLRDLLPDAADAILDHLATLSRLRKAAEKHFPQARAFERPGFDDPRYAPLVHQFRPPKKT